MGEFGQGTDASVGQVPLEVVGWLVDRLPQGENPGGAAIGNGGNPLKVGGLRSPQLPHFQRFDVHWRAEMDGFLPAMLQFRS